MATPISTLTPDELLKRAVHAQRLADEYFLQPDVRKELLAYARELHAELDRRGHCGMGEAYAQAIDAAGSAA
jgi:hypothetical protein